MKIIYYDGDSEKFRYEIKSTDKTTQSLLDEANSIYLSKYSDRFEICDLFAEENRVQDVWRYCLAYNNKNDKFLLTKHTSYSHNFKMSKFNDLEASDLSKDDDVCLIIIESPHKDEYTKDSRFLPIGPAQGTTGLKIEHYFEELFNKNIYDKFDKSELSDIYNIIICNPVQFQTSLYEVHKQPLTKFPTVRNNMWKALYSNSAENHFLERLKSYNPSIIINACTSKLKKNIEETLSNNFEYNYFESSNHPCVWTEKTTFSIKELET